MMRKIILFGAITLLAACGDNDTAPGPGGVTVGEAKALDEAAEMIEARRLPADVLATATPAPSASLSATPEAAE